MDPVTIGLALAKYGPAVYSAFKAFAGGRKDINWNELQNWMQTLHADGSLSPQDYAAADLTQSRLNESADASGRMMTGDALTRIRQRGLDTSPVSEAALQRIAQTTARARQGAGDTAASQLYDTWSNNKAFEQAKLMALVRGRIGNAGASAMAANADAAGNLNSLLGYIPSLIPKSGGAPTSTFATDLNPDKYGGTAGPNLGPRGALSAATRMATSGRQRLRFNPATGRMDYADENAPRYADAGGYSMSGSEKF